MEQLETHHLLQLRNGETLLGKTLNRNLVRPTSDSYIPVFAPSLTPAVFHDPIFLPCFLIGAVAHHQHGVIGQFERVKARRHRRLADAGHVVVYTRFVLLEIGVDLETANSLIETVMSFTHNHNIVSYRRPS